MSDLELGIVLRTWCHSFKADLCREERGRWSRLLRGTKVKVVFRWRIRRWSTRGEALSSRRSGSEVRAQSSHSPLHLTGLRRMSR